MAVVGQGEKLRGAATAPELTANLALRDLANPAGSDQRVEVSADGCGREAKAGAQGTGALGTAIVQGSSDPIPGTGVIGASESARGRCWCLGDDRGFHNTNVTYLPLCVHTPPPRWLCRGSLRVPLYELNTRPTIERDDRIYGSTHRPAHCAAVDRGCHRPAAVGDDGAQAGPDVVDREYRHRVDRWLGPPDQLGPWLPFVAGLLQWRPRAREGAVVS